MNGNHDDGDPRGGWINRSAQIVGGGTKREDLDLVLAQWAYLIALSIVLLGILLLDAIFIGRISVLLAMWFVEALVVFAWIRRARNQAIEQGRQIYSIPAEAEWFAAFAPIVSIFVYPYIVNALFPPIVLELPTWLRFLIVLFSLAFIGWIIYTCIVLAVRMWNPNYPAPFSPASSDSGAFQPLGDNRIWEGTNGDDGEDNRLTEIREMFEALREEPKTRIVTETPIIIENRKPNGRRAAPQQSSDPQVAQVIEDMQPDKAQEPCEYPLKVEWEDRFYIRMARNGAKSTPVRLDLAREFLEMMYIGGPISVRELRRIGLSDKAQDTFKRAMIYAGILEPADWDKRKPAKLILTKDEALSEFDRIFNSNPPTLPEDDTE